MYPIRFDFNRMTSDFLGGDKGITRDMLADIEPTAAAAVHSFAALRRVKNADVAWQDLLDNQDAIVHEIEATATEIKREFDYFVVLGIGGSALGPIAIQQALNHLHYNELPDSRRPGPRFYVEDNIDPERMAALFDIIDVKKTCFNVITKSGKTAETMSQYLIVRDLLKKHVGNDYNRHIITTTSSDTGLLIKIAKRENYRTFYIPHGVGGRFSELCPVGLLPAAVCGIDIRGLLDGARAMRDRCSSDSIWENPALMQAAMMYIANKELGANITVMLPYADSLKYMADWYCQLWAESLGKEVDRTGKKVYAGTTPTKALGVTDQHSQLQLYTEGPFDKVVTFIEVENYRSVVPIPKGCEYMPEVDFLSEKSLNALIDAERKGTEFALTEAGRMNQNITLPEVNANTIGQLIYFFELATAYSGELLNINAFNQPGVEASKKASYAVLGNTGKDYIETAEKMKNAQLPFAEFCF